MLKRLIDKDEVTVVVHSGTFHGDDVACVALLKCVHKTVNIVRKFKVDNPLEEEADYVLDIGKVDSVTENKVCLDHHQGKEEIPGTEIYHCAFSKLVEHMIDHKNSHRLFNKYLLDELVLPIAAQDNGQDYSKFGLVPSPLTFVSSLKLNWEEDQNVLGYSRFNIAVDMAKTVIVTILENIDAKVKAYKFIKEAIDKGEDGVVVFDRYLPWLETVVEHNNGEPKVKLVVYPNNRNGISIQVVPKKIGSFDSWLKIPEDVTKFEGCTGSAHGAFVFFDSIENAKKAAKEIIATAQ